MASFLNPKNWSRLEKTLEQKPNVLLTQFSVLAMIGAIIQIINDAYWLSPNGVLMDISVFLVFLLAYIFNEKRNYLTAKIIFIGFGTTLIFIYGGLVPRNTAVTFLFFPLITINFMIFGNEQRIYKYAFSTYIILLLIVLEATNYQPFGDINITEGIAEPTSYYVNLGLGMFTVIFSMYNIDLIASLILQKQKKVEDDLKGKNQELEKANEELDYFVYSASHDLKAPLSSILGLVNLAKYDVKEPIALDYFEKIETRVERLTKFIKEVIEISKNTRTEIELEACHLEELIDGVIENCHYLEYAKEITFALDIQPKKAILLDRSRLEVILNNLVSNAIKYQKAANNAKKISISTSVTNNQLSITIEDNGSGIDENQLEKVFGMFYRGEQSKEGSGLGLYIVKNMVEKLGGTIRLNSEKNKGTKVELFLPI